MNSTGNDIVALGQTSKERTLDRRFYSQILSASERSLYYREEIPGLPFETFVWLLWSIKESVYKFQRRKQPDLVFAPTKITIQEINAPAFPSQVDLDAFHWENKSADRSSHFFTAVILFENKIYYSRSIVQDKWIASVVDKDDRFENTCWGVKEIEHTDHSSQSLAVREFILQKLSLVLPNHPGDLHIEKDQFHCPGLSSNGKEIPIPLSLAHHDRYIAYSFLLETVQPTVY